MRKIIGGARYDTEGARKLGECDQETLYRTKAGKYFVHDMGCVSARYAGEGQIIPIQEEAARQWCDEHLTPEECAAIWSTIQSGDVMVGGMVSPAAKERLEELKGELGLPANRVIEKAILAYRP